jgi:glycosyltransferase involved in cell wall biosynthesis
MTKVIHLTSVHTRYDIRIFIKECISLAKHGYKVYLVVADGKGDEIKNGVNIHDVGNKPSSRIKRMLLTTEKVFKKAKELDGDIYHLHDPELMPLGLKLKKLGKKIIFDAHEDLPKQTLGKYYLNRFVRYFLSRGITFYEKKVCKKFDVIVTATPSIRDKFLKINPNSIDINNYPILGELLSETCWQNKLNTVCYVGGLSEIRGIKQIVKAMELVKSDATLKLAGSFSDEQNLKDEVATYEGWLKTQFLQQLDRIEVKKLLAESKIGLVTFLPLPNHVDAQPNKMYEYMSASIPIITSDFEMWRMVVDINECGICVNPEDPSAIAKAIDELISNPTKAERMGENGRKAVTNIYNWSIEEKKLLTLYKQLEI